MPGSQDLKNRHLDRGASSEELGMSIITCRAGQRSEHTLLYAPTKQYILKSGTGRGKERTRYDACGRTKTFPLARDTIPCTVGESAAQHAGSAPAASSARLER